MTKRHGVRQDDTNQRPEEVAFALRKEDVEDGRDRAREEETRCSPRSPDRRE